MSLQAQLESLKEETIVKIMAAQDLKELNQIRVETLGKEGPITEILRRMKDLSPEERPKVGSFANKIRDFLIGEIERKKQVLEEEALNAALVEETVDVTLPGREVKHGTRRTVIQIMEEIEDTSVGTGYQIMKGYGVKSDHYNFERMNLPKDHLARDMQDTFYISDEILIRAHTSSVQARTMEEHNFFKDALRVISLGKVFRRDTDDATHSRQFHQIEGLVVDKNITMGDLKGMLEIVMKKMFGEDCEIRLHPSYFPFTEPSAEADVSCFKYGSASCNVCKYTGWVETLGVGMVHPNVLKMSETDPKEYSGFAFGLEPDRVAMLRYGVNDICNFYQNDLCFLSQFKGE